MTESSRYDQLKARLAVEAHTWLITGVAGFIGSNLLETLLSLNQRVVGLDNFATGYQHNLDEVRSLVSSEQWRNFQFIRGDIRNLEDCRRAMFYASFNGRGKRERVRDAHDVAGKQDDMCDPEDALMESIPVDYILHQAALGSVPRSVENPIQTNETNLSGFLNMLVAARDAKAKRFVFAGSSSTYGDHPGLPKIEEKIGKPLSPYAVTKYTNELYADVFSSTYGLECIGLRYFNAFGPRQNPEGAYAAVIPKWISNMIKGETVYINGDGNTSRDFCFVENVRQINLLAAINDTPEAVNQIYNVAVGDRTTLNDLYMQIHRNLVPIYRHLDGVGPVYRDFRTGDVHHSLADISKATRLLGYQPTHRISEGLKIAIDWYVRCISKQIKMVEY